MSSAIEEDLSRVTVISPNRRVDLALPGAVTLGELMPNIVKFAGLEASNSNDPITTWVLQRVGEDPLDITQNVSRLNLSDGETLYLRQRDNAIPDAAFDDVIDAVSSTVDRRPAWEPKHSQRYALAVVLLTVIGIPAMMMFRFLDTGVLAPQLRTLVPSGEPVFVAAMVAGFFMLVTGIASIAVSRAAGEYRVASALAWASIALAAMTGYGALPPSVAASLPVRITIASAFVLVVATALAIAADVSAMGLFTVAVASAVILVCSAIVALVPGNSFAVCAITLVVVSGITALLPGLSYRLAQIALPNLPPDAKAMMADETPVQSDIVTRAMNADKLLSALIQATGIVAMVLALPVAFNRGLWALSLVAIIGVAFLLRARGFVGLQQRLMLLIAGTWLSGLATALLLGRFSALLATGVGLVLVIAVGIILTFYATRLYYRNPNPAWGRMGDVLEWLMVMAVLPVLLGALHLYAVFRGMTSG